MINSLTQLRSAMATSFTGHFKRHSLQGQELRTFFLNLQTLAETAHHFGQSRRTINSGLLQKQAALLAFPQNYRLVAAEELKNLALDQFQLATKLSPSKQAFWQSSLNIAENLALNGMVAHLLLYAGRGERLELNSAKFVLQPTDLLRSLDNYLSRKEITQYQDYQNGQALEPQLAALGGLSNINSRFQKLSPLSLGERIMWNKSFQFYCLAQAKGLEPTEVLRKQKLAVVVNQNTGGEILSSFIRNNFFGFSPVNVLFMLQPEHPTYLVNASGQLEPDFTLTSQGNHGLTLFHSLLDRQWLALIAGVKPGHFHEQTLAAVDFQSFFQDTSVMLVEPIEDTKQYRAPLDFPFIAQVFWQGQHNGILFNSKIVQQKKGNPQNGGALVSLRNQRSRRPRLAIIESDQLLSRAIQPGQIKLLNRGMYGIYSPVDFLEAINNSELINNLHPTFKVNSQSRLPIVRLEADVPLGDANLYVPSGFFLEKEPIQNLKDPVDILRTLVSLEIMEGEDRLLKYIWDRRPV